MKNKPYVSAGIGVMILNKDNQVLLGLRNSDPEKASSELQGEGTWTFPGGKIDFGDSILGATVREVAEETGLRVEKVELMCINNNIGRKAQFLTFGMKVVRYSGRFRTMEPEEIVRWRWFSIRDLPGNLYEPTRKMIDMHRRKGFVDLEEK